MNEININKLFHGYPKKMLTRQEEQEIALLPSDHPDRGKLVTHNFRFLISQALKATNKNKNLWDIHDTVSTMQMAMLESSRTFKPQKGKFISYAIRNMKWRCFYALKRQAVPVKISGNTSGIFFQKLNEVGCFYGGEVKEEHAITEENFSKIFEDEQYGKYLISKIRNLPIREAKIIIGLYVYGKTYLDMSKEMNISISRMDQLRLAGIKRLIKMIKKDGEYE